MAPAPKRSIKVSTRAQVFSLARANAVDQAFQFVMPIVLTRFLDAEGFAAYRMFWLATATVTAFASLALPQSLYYFLPRRDPDGKRVVLSNTLTALVASGLVGAVVANPWHPLLPNGSVPLSTFGALLPAFIFVWVVSTMLDDLANADQRVPLQARIILSLSILRLIVVAGAAALSSDITWVLQAWMFMVLLKFGVMAGYFLRYHGWPVRPQLSGLIEQLHYALPFAVAGALFSFIQMADQWIAALLFSPTDFAAFSIAGAAGPVAMTVSYSVANAVLPKLSAAHAAGDIDRMVDLNRRANTAVAFVLHPLLVVLFVMAEPVISLVYTSQYATAAGAMQVYLVGLLAYSFQANSLLRMFSMGMTATWINGSMFLFALAASYIGALHLGIPGAAIGGALARAIGQFAGIALVAPKCGVSATRVVAWGEWLTLLAAACLGGAGAWWVDAYWTASWPSIARLGAAGLIVLLGYLAALLLSGRWDLVTRHMVLGRARS